MVPLNPKGRSAVVLLMKYVYSLKSVSASGVDVSASRDAIAESRSVAFAE